MKKIVTLFLAACMMISLVACGGKTEEPAKKAPETLGEHLLADFEERLAENADQTAQELADGILTNELIQFAGMAMPVEPGFLTGFGNEEITGFDEGVMFAPMIGSIPFVGYVFVLEDEAGVEGFVTTLTDNADPRWNICVEAEETVVGSVANKVFFVMCPKTLEQ